MGQQSKEQAVIQMQIFMMVGFYLCCGACFVTVPLSQAIRFADQWNSLHIYRD